MPNTPVKLPEDLVRAPHRFIHDMAVGETGWIDWSDMIINLERCCYLYADAKLKPDEGGYLTIRITRTADGFEVFIPAMRVTPTWTPQAFQRDKGHFAVVKPSPSFFEQIPYGQCRRDAHQPGVHWRLSQPD
jgi:hypothetical protein